MGLSATMVWEFRSGATAANANGGAFKPGASGTDWSQQTAAQYNLTSITSAGAGNVILTASASADMVGNAIHMISGTNFTPGWFEITAVSVGVSITCSTNQAGTAICVTGAGSAGIANIGGAMSMNSSTANQSDANLGLAISPGNTVYMQGAFTLGINFSPTAGVAGTPVTFIGYQTVRGDNPLLGNRPTINCGAASTFSLGVRNQAFNLNLTGSNTVVFSTATDAFIVNTKVTNNSTTAARFACSNASGASGYFERCEFISYRGIAFNMAAGCTINGCYIHDSDTGIANAATTPVMISDSIFAGNVTAAINTTGGSTNIFYLKNNTFYGAESKLGTGVILFAGQNDAVLVNNNFYGLVTAVNDGNGVGFSYENFNDFFNCTTARTGITAGPNSIAVNPGFSNVAQITGVNGTTSGSVLTSAGATFTGITVNQDFCYISAGTGITAGKYMITAFTATTLTLDIAPGTSAVADKIFSVTTGNNFAVGSNVKQIGTPSAFGASTASFVDLGAAQRNGDLDQPATTDVRSGVSFNNGTKTGTLVSSGGTQHLGPGKMG